MYNSWTLYSKKMNTQSKNKIFAWCSYDFANSAFPTIILTVAFGIFFKSVVVQDTTQGDWLWGLSLSLSYLLIALSAPLLGTISDQLNKKRLMLIIFCSLSCIATALLFFSTANTILWSMICVIIANYAFATSNVFYNAFLPSISTAKNIGRISGWGWAFGYMGGLLSLAICYPLISNGFLIPHETHYKLSF